MRTYYEVWTISGEFIERFDCRISAEQWRRRNHRSGLLVEVEQNI